MKALRDALALLTVFVALLLLLAVALRPFLALFIAETFLAGIFYFLMGRR